MNLRLVSHQSFTASFFAKYASVLAIALLSFQTQAHSEVGVAGGLMSGFLHPIYGLDHMLAMIAVGMWGAQLGKPAMWVLPITFPIVMAIGGLLGIAGVPLPFVELGISASALALGAAVALCLRPALPIAAVLVAVFAIYHGYAHGTELPDAANPLAYGVGFVVSTGLMHLVGIIFGLLIKWPVGQKVVRGVGVVIAVVGVFFVARTLGLVS